MFHQPVGAQQERALLAACRAEVARQDCIMAQLKSAGRSKAVIDGHTYRIGRGLAGEEVLHHFLPKEERGE